MHWSKRIVLAGLTLWALFYSPHILAQESQYFRPEQRWLRLAEEQYQYGHYDLARQAAVSSLAYARNPLDSALARYYSAVSVLRADTLTGLDSGRLFLSTQISLVHRQRVALGMAQTLFRKGQFSASVPYYEAAGIANLTNDELIDARFELAYGYFYTKRFDKAQPLFGAIRQTPGKYYMAGNYYYGLLAYNNGNYPEALASFKKVENEKQYRGIVPYYVAEIYYFTGDRKQALKTALELIKREDKLYYDKELHLLAAQILFEEGRYGEALPYFENYYDRTDRIRKEELYEMAYSYYNVREWQSAIEKFKQLNTSNDSLGQTAMYLLGDCYLKTNDKKSARNAFGLCANMPFSKKQQEASLILHAKLSFDLGYDDDAKQSLTQLIVDYPKSAYQSEAKTLLSELLIKTSNYAGAYDLLRQVSTRDAAYWRVHQRVTYGLAVVQLQDGNLNQADSFFTQSLNQATDEQYIAATHFWRGEIAMRRKRYPEAVSQFRQFTDYAERHRNEDYAGSGASLAGAWLNLGYASLLAEKYEDARTYFGKIRAENAGKTGGSETATVREADALFMMKDYKGALNLYNDVIDMNGEEAPYSRLQKAILLGVLGRKNEKVALLQFMIKGNEPYRIAVQARYELGLTYIEDDKYQLAISALEPLTSDANSGYGQKAWIRTGFAWQELNNDTKAIEAYRRAVADYPASEERIAALEALKSLYVERNEPDAYARFLKENNLQSGNDASVESTYYTAAEAQFASGKWLAAKQAFQQYISQFPTGTSLLPAQYYLAESHYQLKEYQDALQVYDRVLAQPWNEFSENSVRRALWIAEKENQYTAAIRYARLLLQQAPDGENRKTAYAGMMNAAYKADSFSLAAQYADSMLAQPGLEEQQLAELQFYKARAVQQQGLNAEALLAYQAIKNLKNATLAAELGYRIGEIQYVSGNLKDAEASAAANLKTAAGNDFWTVKTFLLIADILVQQKDYFNARATLQSVIRNTKNTALKAEAARKLEEVKKAEKGQSKLAED